MAQLFLSSHLLENCIIVAINTYAVSSLSFHLLSLQVLIIMCRVDVLPPLCTWTKCSSRALFWWASESPANDWSMVKSEARWIHLLLSHLHSFLSTFKLSRGLEFPPISWRERLSTQRHHIDTMFQKDAHRTNSCRDVKKYP